MKQTGIIMSGNHPELILDDLKTMTRRTYGLEKVNQSPSDWEFKRLNDGGIALFWRSNIMEEDIALCKCPYGQVGDLLWVREAWATDRCFDKMSWKDIEATKVATVPIWYKVGDTQLENPNTTRGRWRSSRFTPKYASRITLEITELWPERLRGISPADAIAEGGYTVDEFIAMYLKLNKLPDDADPWNWAFRFRRL